MEKINIMIFCFMNLLETATQTGSVKAAAATAAEAAAQAKFSVLIRPGHPNTTQIPSTTNDKMNDIYNIVQPYSFNRITESKIILKT